MNNHPPRNNGAEPNDAMVNWARLFPDQFAREKVCVTGGAGFIGSHLVDALVSMGAEVVVVDDLTTGDEANLAQSARRTTLLRDSILAPQRWAQAVKGCDVVFHLAAMGSVPRSIVEPQRCLDVNVQGTMNVLAVAQSAGVRRVVFSGSSSAYGSAPGADSKTESMPPLPRSPYAASKLAGEHLMRAWSASYGLDTAVLRYFNIFGPRQNGASAYAAAVAAFADALGQGRPGTIYGDGSHTRDFTFVANAVYANLLAASHAERLEGDVFNIATGHSPTVRELHDVMAKDFGLEGVQPNHVQERLGDVPWSLADISHAHDVLGYRPIVGFEDGLAATVSWYKQHAKRRSAAA